MPEQNNTISPLVSIITRSMDRPTLSDALDSIALQTYLNIEIVVVNAKGSTHKELGEWCGNFPLRLIQSNQPLNRSSAANVGLKAAKGEYLIFLDDDDLFYPEHITVLVSALQQHKQYRCVYTGTRVDHYVDGQPEHSTTFNELFDPHRLLSRNFIPIHSLLFEQSLVTSDQCAFDETLEVFEDWDFWIQISQLCEILHIDNITAIYRNYGHSGLGSISDKRFLRQMRSKIYEKWKSQLTGEQLEDMIQYWEDKATDLNEQNIASDQQNNTLNEQNNTLNEQNNTLNEQNNTLNEQNNTLNEQNIALDRQNTALGQQITALHDHTNHLRSKNTHLANVIMGLTQSSSWKITAPLRFLFRIARGQHREALAGLRQQLIPLLKIIYWQLPATWRNTILTTAFQKAGSFFADTEHYKAWYTNKKHSDYHYPAPSHEFLAEMADLQNFTQLRSKSPGRIAIHAHIFYPDLATEFKKFLRNMPFAYDLFVSTPNESASKLYEQAFSNLPKLEQLTISTVPNRGRDIAPMFCTFGEALQSYDYIAHIHSKKSLHNEGTTNGWREYILTNLLGNESSIRRIFTLLTGEANAGIVYPQNFSSLHYSIFTWLANQTNGRVWCNRLGIKNFPTGYFDYPAGSMFWAKAQALRPLFEAKLTIEDFPEEAGQRDGTLAHCLERLFVLVSKQSGFNAFILRDIQSKSWSRWRFDQYFTRTQEKTHAILANTSTQIIIFEIFNTLLTRPLLNPDSIKSIVAKKAGRETGKIYLEFRATAEAQARQKSERDIDLDAIFKEFAALSGLSSETITQLRRLEETVEIEAVAPRPEAVSLLQLAKVLNKRVLLTSDLYLPKSIIETMLWNNGITAWDQLYLSSDIGLRKDTGDLYRHILIQEQTTHDVVMVIGDNEYSDIQAPGSLGIRSLHVLRPVELARAIPRLGPVIDQSFYGNDLNAQLTLGMLVRENYQPLFYPHFDPSDLVPTTPWSIGFTVAGPLILSFIQWLTKKASADGIRHFYFLAGKGQILKKVFDRWASNNADAITSDYLILSRRTVTVPMISNLDDILEIARKHFFPNSLSMFIQERYGLTLSPKEYEILEKRKLWPKKKLVSVEDQRIDHLTPILQTFKDRILAHAKNEHSALMAYLNNLDLNTDSSSAVVDIGYAATIQGCLNRLMNQTIHGYYLVTDERAQKVASQHSVITQGCFGHFVDAAINPPLIFRGSFSMEKLLSSDEPQIIRYRSRSNGDIISEFRDLTEEERQTTVTRTEIHQGIMDFVDQSIAVRDKLANDFMVPPDLAKTIFETFVKDPSSSELAILSKLVLDDYYCGRGLVN